MASELPQNGQQFEGASWGEGGYGIANDTQHSDQQVQDPAFSHDPASHGDQEDGADDAGEYDPESVTAAPVPQIAEPTASTSTSGKPEPTKPKTSGGFLVGDSDDEDDAPTPASSNIRGVQDRSPLQIPTPTQGQVGASTSVQVNNGGPTNGGGAAASSQGVNPAKRHPNDNVGILEDRIKEDPRGDVDAWLSLIAEHRRQNKLNDLRSVYHRFVSVFPQAADIWVEWIQLELDSNNFPDAEKLFGRSLMTVPNVQLWTIYLNYIRRRNDLTIDPDGQARRTLTQAYEFVIDNIGIDRDSGQIWMEYIQFIKNGPGQPGGTGWQDMQKMDQLRKAYHRAICVPMSTVSLLWKDYDQFEMSLNKATGRTFIQKRSPGYMSAKGASMQLDRMINRLQRTNVPRLPPAPGFNGDQEFMEQVDLWKKWIQWEKEDPLVLEAEEPEVYKQRILYCYKQALMAVRFWPEMWVDAAEWCFANNITKDGTQLGLDFLTQGIAANPESVLLALKHGDRIEMTHAAGDDEAAKATRAKAVREPYDRVLDTLYGMMQKLKEREKNEARKMEEATTSKSLVKDSIERNDDEDELESPEKAAKEEMMKAVKQGFVVQVNLMKRTISFVWVALARAMRRVQGKGSQNGGLRQVFMDARARGQLSSDIYVAVALMESLIYKDVAGPKIFDRGAKLFPEDEVFMLEYIKFLHTKDDTTNARVVFETCVNRLTQKEESKDRARSLYLYFHKYESQYGELSSIAELEKRMADLWPNDPKLSHFSNRYSVDNFDPIAYRLIVSPAIQLRPKMMMPFIEQPASIHNSPPPQPIRQTASPAPQYLGATNSPKRPFAGDDQEEHNRPRKLARGESPLKGAAGRRLDQQRRTQGAPLARDITFFLTLLPPANTYNAIRFNAHSLVGLVRDTPVPDYSAWKTNQDQVARHSSGIQSRAAPPPSHGRQVSGEYAAYGSYPTGRESPNPAAGGQRPLSPYGASAAHRLAPPSGVYRNSPLRPGSSGSYEPPPAAYRQDAPPLQQAPPGQYPPQVAYDGSGVPVWQPQPQPPVGYGQPPAQQHGNPGQQYRYPY